MIGALSEWLRLIKDLSMPVAGNDGDGGRLGTCNLFTEADGIIYYVEGLERW